MSTRIEPSVAGAERAPRPDDHAEGLIVIPDEEPTPAGGARLRPVVDRLVRSLEPIGADL